MVPDAVRREVEAAFAPFTVAARVGGGCIHPALRIESGGGSRFLKYGERAPEGFFAAEAEGLRQLAAATSQIRVPEVDGWSDAGPGREYGWILMEWLEPGAPGGDYPERLAAGLNELHQRAEAGWGWDRAGFIGTLPQANGATVGWADFWRTRRLEPQLALAHESGRLPGKLADWDRLFADLPRLLAAGEEDGPSLLHGDLWSGNILATQQGHPAIVDPAAYHGHREVDLAMAELFGSPGSRFFHAYEALRPLQPGYGEWRRGIYQLYYLLVHVNLFGDGYIAPTASTLRAVLASV